MKNLILFAIALACSGAIARPSIASLTAEEEKCGDLGGGNGTAICIAEIYDTADGLLNEIFQDIKYAMNNSGKASDKQRFLKVRNDQRAWIAKRDATCQIKSENEGGSLANVIHESCLFNLTIAQVLVLQQIDVPYVDFPQLKEVHSNGKSFTECQDDAEQQQTRKGRLVCVSRAGYWYFLASEN